MNKDTEKKKEPSVCLCAMDRRVLVNNNWLSKKQKTKKTQTTLFVAFDIFHGVNFLTMTNFKLPM